MKPKDATFISRSDTCSSKVMITPGSPNSIAPLTINSIEKRVLPAPAAPQTSVGLPAGMPPPVISSSPVIPVGVLERDVRGLEDPFLLGGGMNQVFEDKNNG